MPAKREVHPLWSIVQRTKADGARRDGCWIVWADRNGARRMTCAGRTRKVAEAAIRLERAAIDEKVLTKFAAETLKSLLP